MNKTSVKKASRTIKVVLVAVIFFGLFFQIGMLAKISAQTKKADRVSDEIVELTARAENLELALSRLKNPERIEALALEMGMTSPGEGAIRVVSLPALDETTTTQTAERTDADGVYQ